MTIPSVSQSDDTIVAEVLIHATPARVWAALTDGRLLATWWGSADTYRANDWQLDVRVGGAWSARGLGADGTPFSVTGEFLEVTPTDRLMMTWDPSWDTIPPTTILYELTGEASGTRLRLTHSGFTDHAASRDGHMMGWQRVLGWLVAFAELEPASGG